MLNQLRNANVWCQMKVGTQVVKQLANNKICVLQATNSTITNALRPVVNPKYAKYRGSEFFVSKIYDSKNPQITYENGHSIFNSSFQYIVGKNVYPDHFNMNNGYNVCDSGIHYFLTEDGAKSINKQITNSFTGYNKIFSDDGQLIEDSTYVNGKLSGKQYRYYDTGDIISERIHLDGVGNCNIREWYIGYMPHNFFTIRNGTRHGIYRSWWPNGKMKEKSMWEYGKCIDIKQWNDESD